MKTAENLLFLFVFFVDFFPTILLFSRYFTPNKQKFSALKIKLKLQPQSSAPFLPILSSRILFSHPYSLRICIPRSPCSNRNTTVICHFLVLQLLKKWVQRYRESWNAHLTELRGDCRRTVRVSRCHCHMKPGGSGADWHGLNVCSRTVRRAIVREHW